MRPDLANRTCEPALRTGPVRQRIADIPSVQVAPVAIRHSSWTSINDQGLTPMTETLFTPFAIGDIDVKNRIVMAPLTRNRARAEDDTPFEIHAEYYAQRAGAGLIITEGTQISPEGKGYAWTPGIHSAAQVAGWRKVTDAVHAKGGRIAAQLWHVGRISHTSLQVGGAAPVAPSAIGAGSKTFDGTGFVETSVPRALDLDEIPRVIEDYRKAARNADAAGFDGVDASTSVWSVDRGVEWWRSLQASLADDGLEVGTGRRESSGSHEILGMSIHRASAQVLEPNDLDFGP